MSRRGPVPARPTGCPGPDHAGGASGEWTTLLKAPLQERHSYRSALGLLVPPMENMLARSAEMGAASRTIAVRRGQSVGRRSSPLNNWALSATMMVDRLINTAPTAGARTNPIGARTPAANGTATTLYPAAHTRFWIIFR